MRADTVRDLCLADRRAAAEEALAGGGGVAAEAIVRELADDSSPVDRWHVVPVLRRIGATAFGPLARALLDAPTLSARYGRAQAYHYGARGDGSAWPVAERGTVLRRYCETGEGEDELLTPGEPLPFERVRRAELGLSPERDAAQESDEDEAEWRTAAFDLAPELAKALGVSPLAIGPDTRACGAGVVAMTPYGVAHGVPTGVYRI
ncbi:hypothetical protein [Streptomyces sp. NPDC024089]|uniref:hypothetical protein n=1 Tax=Streptomyces sp. NPDC024089 TaxID=3154328 RepID=UPI00340C8D84